MDTILSPRLLNRTADDDSDESETEKGTTVHASTNPSTIDNELRLGVTQPEQQKIIKCPTARYLEVNHKKISSFDLLVHPPKRPRLQSPSTSSNDVSYVDFTILQSVHYENEKKDKISSIGSSCTSSNKGNSDGEQVRGKTIMQLCQSANPNVSHPDNHNLLDGEKTFLLYKQKGRDTNTPQTAELVVDHHSLERIDELDDTDMSKLGDDADFDKWAEFPSSKNYIYYVNYSHQFSTIFPPKPVTAVFKTVNEKDENKNYLTNKSKSEEVNQMAFPYLVSSNASRGPVRTFKKPVYRLTGVVNCERVNLPAPERDSYHVNQRLTDVAVTTPPFKRRKLNAPGYDVHDQEKLPMKEAHLIFRICNELSQESKTIGIEKNASPPAPQSNAASTPSVTSIKLNAAESESESQEESQQMVFFEDDSEDDDLHPSITFTPITMLRNIFHHPRIHSEPIGIGNSTNDLLPSYNEGRGTAAPTNLDNNNIPISESEDRSATSLFKSHGTPFTIILQKPPLDMDRQNISNPAFLFPTMGFHLSAMGESNLTIEDVTDECNDNGVENVTTILAAGDRDMYRIESTSCSLVDFRSSGSDYEEEAETEQPYNVKAAIRQEVLLQPNPQLTLSSSVHSLPQNDRNDVTLDRFLERRRKSDYFVGKLAGLSKSIMKLYQRKKVKATKRAPNNGEESHVANELEKSSNDNNNLEANQSKSKANIFSDVSSPVDIDFVRSAPSRTKASTFRIRTALTSSPKKIPESNEISNSTLVSHEKSTGDRGSVQAATVPSNNLLSASESSTHDKPSCCCGGGNAQRSSSANLRVDKMANEDSLPKTSEMPLKDDHQDARLPSMSIFKRFLKLFSKSTRTSKKVRIKQVESASSADLPESEETSYDSLDQRRDRRMEYIAGKGGLTTPCYHCSRIIARHTDSKEFYRERRMKFFKELQEFQEDSLKGYLETTSKNLQNISFASMNCSKLSMKLASGKVDRLISEHVGEGKNSHNINSMSIPPSTALLSPRKAISTSALSVGETRLRNFLLPSLPIPPIIDMIMGESLASCKNLNNSTSIRAKGDADGSCIISSSGSNEKTRSVGNKNDLHNKSPSISPPENNNNITANSTTDNQGNLAKCFSPTKGILKNSNKI